MTLAVQFKDGAVVFDDEKVAFGCPGVPCNPCSGDTPKQFRLDFVGLITRYCMAGKCEAANGSYIVTQSESNACVYWYFFPGYPSSPPCWGSYIRLIIGSGSASVVWNTGSTYIVWFGSGWSTDCTSWSLQNVPLDTDIFCNCNGWSSTCKLTAL